MTKTMGDVMKTEIAVIKNELKNIKEVELANIKCSMNEMKNKIDLMYDTFIKGEGKISVLNKEVFGNGKPGLREKINNLARYVWMAVGGLGVLTFILNWFKR